MKYFLLAGEVSGDIHGAKLIYAIRQLDKDAQFRAWGGDKMNMQGALILKHIKELSFFGFWQVIINLPSILRNIKLCQRQILEFQPDVVIGIDYPGFNLKILTWAKKNQFTTIQYVLPHVWIWKEGRVKTLRQYCDHVLCILPFEETYCKTKNIQATYIGNPIAEYMDEEEKKIKSTISKNYILLLPGSRAAEVKNILPIMLKVTQKYPEEKFKILKSPNLEKSFYTKFLLHLSNVELIETTTILAMKEAKAGIIKSGTSTLEAALVNFPFFVVYKLNFINAFIINLMTNIKYISLPNIILDESCLVELRQYNFNKKTASAELEKILSDEASREIMKKKFENLKQLLLLSVKPSDKAASIIFEHIKKQNQKL